MEKKTIRSTSLHSAECSDIVLREQATTRLVFHPQLVDNPKEASAGVRGTFLFQRKGKTEEWEDVPTVPLTSLKKGEGYKLELHSAELLTLFVELQALYRFHSEAGVPLGETELVRVDSAVARLAALPREELRVFLTANREIGEDLLSSLLSWAVSLKDPGTLISRLVSLSPFVLRDLSAALGLEGLRRALTMWDENSRNSDEEFWQNTLVEHSYVLEQVFSWPATIVKGKAYVGGKSVLDRGGNVVDFLVKNYFTNNAALVEIKTPATRMLTKKYRDGVYCVSEELAGSVMQVLNYRFNLQREYYSLTHGLLGGLETFAPRCVVIIGSTEELKDSDDKAKSLELFRENSSSVAVITFDELFQKTRRLVEVLQAT